MNTKFLGALAAAGLALTMATSASAAIIYTPVQAQSVALQTATFFDAPMVFDKFDSSLGTLTQIIVTLEGNVEGNAAYENQSPSPATINLNLQAQISLTRPGGGNMAQVLPVANIMENASGFDGVIDFGGTSGSTFTGLTASANDNQILVSPADLALFTAAFLGETITLELDAIGNSFGSGSGSMITQFLTLAGANATIQYAYDDGIEIAEPGMLAAFGFGLLGLGLMRRRRQAA
ncbi:MAG: choice-of-anchor E domain-containing protein [Rhodospirillaceae bacterium]